MRFKMRIRGRPEEVPSSATSTSPTGRLPKTQSRSPIRGTPEVASTSTSPSTSHLPERKSRSRNRVRPTPEVASTSSSPTGHLPKRKSKSQKWRDDLKNSDPTKHAKMSSNAKDYSRYYRMKMAESTETLNKRRLTLTTEEKNEAEVWQKRKAKYNESKRRRMNKMNERKRADARKVADKSTASEKKPTRRKTRVQRETKKEKERLKKQRQRANCCKEKHEAILARRSQLYHDKNTTKRTHLTEERKKLQEKESELNDLLQRLQAKEKELEEQRQDL